MLGRCSGCVCAAVFFFVLSFFFLSVQCVAVKLIGQEKGQKHRRQTGVRERGLRLGAPTYRDCLVQFSSVSLTAGAITGGRDRGESIGGVCFWWPCWQGDGVDPRWGSGEECCR